VKIALGTTAAVGSGFALFYLLKKVRSLIILFRLLYSGILIKANFIEK
jgi:hypothetical protein